MKNKNIRKFLDCVYRLCDAQVPCRICWEFCHVFNLSTVTFEFFVLKNTIAGFSLEGVLSCYVFHCSFNFLYIPVSNFEGMVFDPVCLGEAGYSDILYWGTFNQLKCVYFNNVILLLSGMNGLNIIFLTGMNGLNIIELS